MIRPAIVLVCALGLASCLSFPDRPAEATPARADAPAVAKVTFTKGGAPKLNGRIRSVPAIKRHLVDLRLEGGTVFFHQDAADGPAAQKAGGEILDAIHAYGVPACISTTPDFSTCSAPPARTPK